MSQEPYSYCVYIIRVWKENNLHIDNAGWRFTVTAMPSEQRRGFAAPEALCDALYAELLQIIQRQQPTQNTPLPSASGQMLDDQNAP